MVTARVFSASILDGALSESCFSNKYWYFNKQPSRGSSDGKCMVRNHLQARIPTGFHRFKEIGQIFHYNYILSKKF